MILYYGPRIKEMTMAVTKTPGGDVTESTYVLDDEPRPETIEARVVRPMLTEGEEAK